jgi:hypothetical protein
MPMCDLTEHAVDERESPGLPFFLAISTQGLPKMPCVRRGRVPGGGFGSAGRLDWHPVCINPWKRCRFADLGRSSPSLKADHRSGETI